MTDKTIDVPSDAQPETLAVQVQAPKLPTPVVNQPHQMTAAQAKVDAVANLTMKAYERASTLQLTEQEITALQADFPDSAFQPGAAGKEHLIYIEHAHLRDRLNQVFGPGQWAIVPRSRWAEDFRTFKGGQASRVYVEAMLLIRGCFVSEAVGEMEYYPNNAGQNYGDAVEGAKTAALRRCCKELGIGLQAWKKDWCEGWWKRRRGGRTFGTTITPQAPPADAPKQAPRPAKGNPAKEPPVETVLPRCDVKMVTEKHSPPEAKKPWTAYFILLNDGFADLEVGTFSKTLAGIASTLSESNAPAEVTFRPGKIEGKFELVNILPANQPHALKAQEDEIPMQFDEKGQPIPETIP